MLVSPECFAGRTKFFCGPNVYHFCVRSKLPPVDIDWALIWEPCCRVCLARRDSLWETRSQRHKTKQAEPFVACIVYGYREMACWRHSRLRRSCIALWCQGASSISASGRNCCYHRVHVVVNGERRMRSRSLASCHL